MGARLTEWANGMCASTARSAGGKIFKNIQGLAADGTVDIREYRLGARVMCGSTTQRALNSISTARFVWLSSCPIASSLFHLWLVRYFLLEH